MTLYDNFINQIFNILPEELKEFDYETSKLKKGDKNSILLLRDTAYELGGSQMPCISTTVASSEISFKDGVYLYGKDLCEIKNDCPFGKFVFLYINDIPEEKTYDVIKELEQIRYNYVPDGFMSRASALSLREQIRVSKKAVKRKITFKDYGNALIDEYKKNPIVKAVKVVFLTDFNNYDDLYILCDKIKRTTSALNHIFDNILYNCSSCSLKTICDEVEGMKELHMKNK